MRESVKIRIVAGSVVVSLPQTVLAAAGIQVGDRVIVEATPPRRILITKEGKPVTSTQRLELEIGVLEKKMKALESDLSYKIRQYNDSMPVEAGMADNSVAQLMMDELIRDRDRLDADIAEKRLQLHDIRGASEET